MTVTFTRILRYGWQGFLRNGSLSFSTISIVILAAIVFEGLILFGVISNGAVSSIQEKIDITVYFKQTVSEDAVLNVKKSLERLPEVADVEYISREQALEEFTAAHVGDEAISQTLKELSTNPLLASLNIKARDPHDYQTVAQYLEGGNAGAEVEKVTYAQNQVVIERLVSIIDTIKRGGITLTLFLALLAIVVTFNTIRLAIFSNREQIGIMRVVGASNTFIRGPYLIEGVLYGTLAAIVSFIVMVPLINFTSPYVGSFIPELNLANYFSNNMWTLFGYQILFCVGLGIVSSFIAIRRYLHI